MRDAGRGGAVVTPLSDAERSRRYRQRKRERDAAGRLLPGHEVTVKHGAFSPRLTGPRARDIAGAFLAAPSCPSDARGDPVLMDAILAWAESVAEVERLRAYRDHLDEQLGAGAVEAALTEETTAQETETRPAMGAVKRESLTRQRESLSTALHRAEMRARTMRNDLTKRLGASAGSKTIDLAQYWAQRAERREAEGDAG